MLAACPCPHLLVTSPSFRYVQATAGKLYRANYNRAAQRFTFQYEVLAGVTNNVTEVFVPMLSFPEAVWQCDKGVGIVSNRTLGSFGTIVYIKHDSTLAAGTNIQIEVCTETSRCAGWGHAC